MHVKFTGSQWNDALQRHLLSPCPVALQEEFGQSMQSIDLLQGGSDGRFQWISSSWSSTSGNIRSGIGLLSPVVHELFM